MVMTHQKLAELLNGRPLGDEITHRLEKDARQLGLVVIFGASDDLCELRGAVHDKVGVYDGGEFYLRNGKVLQMPDDDEAETLEKFGIKPEALKEGAIHVEAKWCKVAGYSWTYECSKEHSTFDIMEGEDKYCRGIVLSLL